MGTPDKTTPPALFTQAVFEASLKWWGIRFLIYNCIMFVTGIAALIISNKCSPHIDQGMWKYFSTRMYVDTTIYYALLADISFAMGASALMWAVKRFPELIPSKEKFYRFFFTLGLVVSIGLNLLLAIMNWLLRINNSPL